MTTGNHPAPTVEAWLQEFVEAGLRAAEVGEFVHLVNDEILDAIPEIAGDPALVEELHASTREHWRNFLVSLSGEHRLAVPPAAIAFSLSIARRHLDISVLLKVYRVANRSVFRYVAEHTTAASLPDGLPRDEALLALWLRAERWIDESIEQLIGHYTQERASLAAGAQARRAETIEALVAGATPSHEVEAVLGHKLRLWQTAFVLSARPDTESDTSLYDLAVRVCQVLGLPRPLTHLAGSRELWGWVATPDPPEITLAEVAPLIESLDLHLALGRSLVGPTGFRTSHLQALSTQRVGLRSHGACHDYDEVELVCLIGDGELAREMVRRDLGPLLGQTRSDAVLRTTALAYLRSGFNVELTAEALFVHPNTVRYRVSRIEELLGHRIAERPGALEICLTWLQAFGAEALG